MGAQPFLICFSVFSVKLLNLILTPFLHLSNNGVNPLPLHFLDNFDEGL
jgi:hypothetical protein